MSKKLSTQAVLDNPQLFFIATKFVMFVTVLSFKLIILTIHVLYVSMIYKQSLDFPAYFKKIFSKVLFRYLVLMDGKPS